MNILQSIFSFWQSAPALSKLQNTCAACAIIASIGTLTFKIRGDHLRRLSDAPRHFTAQQRAKFVGALANISKGELTVSHSIMGKEVLDFVEEIRSLMTEAGFQVPQANYALSYWAAPKPPWHLGIIGRTDAQPAFAAPVAKAFHEIGVEVELIDGTGIVGPGAIVIYVGGM